MEIKYATSDNEIGNSIVVQIAVTCKPSYVM